MNQPENIYRIALDDYLGALQGRISAETLGKVRDELGRNVPNLLKDPKKHVQYDARNENQHAHIVNPSHKITVTRIVMEEL